MFQHLSMNPGDELWIKIELICILICILKVQVFLLLEVQNFLFIFVRF